MQHLPTVKNADDLHGGHKRACTSKQSFHVSHVPVTSEWMEQAAKFFVLTLVDSATGYALALPCRLTTTSVDM